MNVNLVQAFTNWIENEEIEGQISFYVNFMFDPLRKSESSNISDQMKDAIYGPKGSFYGKLCNQLEKHPKRKSRQRFLPRAKLFFDLPVFKNEKKGTIRNVWINHGRHINGIISVFPKSWCAKHLELHIAQNQSLYACNGINRVHAMPITHNLGRVVDYAMKTIKSGRVDFDSTIILPRAYTEMRSSECKISPTERLVKNVQSATNLSHENAVLIVQNQLAAKVA